MQTIFLKDGTQANLITKTENGFIVDPLEIYKDYETKEEYTEPSGNVRLVDKIYETAPREVVDEEYQQILLKVEEQEGYLIDKRKELQEIKSDIDRLNKLKTNAEKMIINRQELANAKRLIIWIKDQIHPRILDGKSSLKLTISYKISQFESEEKCWAYSAYSDYERDGWSSYSEYFDEKYGIKTDLTDEEILSITHERQAITDFSNHSIEYCPESWLTPYNIEKKKELVKKREAAELKNAENDLLKIQEKIKKLRNEVTVS